MKPKSHIAILLSASLALALGACSSSSDDGPPRMMLDLMGLTPSGDPQAGETITIPAGEEVTKYGITAECPAGGPDCVIYITDDGAEYSGGKPKLMAASTPKPADPAIAQRAAIKGAIGKAKTAVGMVDDESTNDEVTKAENAIKDAKKAITDAADVPAAEKAAYSGEIAAHENTLNAAKNSRKMAMDDAVKEGNAMAKKLYAGLGESSTSLDGATVTINAGTGKVMADTDDGSADPAAFELKATDTKVMPYGSWKGTDYVVKTKSMTDHAVIYSNPGEPEKEPFADKHTDVSEGRLAQTNFVASLVASEKFASGSGGKDHTDEAGDVAGLRGTYDGADGLYQCSQTGTTACRSQVDGEGGIILTGGWTFKPDKNAMTSTPDNSYVAYGWWSRETATGVDVATFVIERGTSTEVSTTDSVTGTASYKGGAAGKYAINNPLGNGSEAGAFTAAATLTAKFGSATAEGTISGMLTDFKAGGMDKDWTVTLKGAGTESGAPILTGGFGDNSTTTDVNESATVWTIGGTAADASGMWSGDFYEAGEGTGDAPMTAAGTFSSEYGNAGRMVGAFGARLSDILCK